MTLVAGVDSSTQSVKVVVCEAATGRVVREGRADHPEGTEVDPEHWWQALQQTCAGGLLDGVRAMSVAGQQHGMVALDEDDAVVRPALLWNDVRSADSAQELVAELGGRVAWAEAVGSVPVASFTVTKLRWLATHEPAQAARTVRVALPHDWLTHRLTGNHGTDRGDVSGTGWWSPRTGEYRRDLVRRALGADLELPRVLGPAQAAGTTSDGVLVGPGTGDNMGAALGLGLVDGDVVVSLGTSGTAFARHPDPVADGTGLVAGFADATGHYLPLVATMNAARVLLAGARLLGTDPAGLSDLALAAPAGAGGLVMLPWLDGERSPDLPGATGSLHGLTRTTMSPAFLARACVEGMLCGLADAVDALVAVGVRPRRVLLVGGAARSPAVQEVLPGLLGLPVVVPPPGEYVALGAARQAAWVLAGTAGPPSWSAGPCVSLSGGPDGAGAAVRARYAECRDAAVAAAAAGAAVR